MAAPTYVGAGSLVSTNTVGAYVTPAWPAPIAGDIGILLVETAVEDAELLDAAGFAPLPIPVFGAANGAAGGTSSVMLRAYWCRATSNAMRAPRVAAPPIDHVAALIVTFRGCKQTGNPWNQVGYNFANAATAFTMPGLTTTVDECLIVSAIANATDTLVAQASGWTNAGLTSLIERVDANTDAGNGGGIAVATGIKATAGLVNGTTGTLATSSVQARIDIALRPLVAASAAGLYTFLTLQDPAAPDLEITLNVLDFRWTQTQWRGSLRRAWSGNFMDSRHTPKREGSATVEFTSRAGLDALELFLDIGLDLYGVFQGSRPLLMRSDGEGPVGTAGFVSVLVEIENQVPSKDTPGYWTADLVLRET